MAWLSSTTLQPSDPLTNVNLNNLALDIQNWGGNVNGGGYSLFNANIIGVLSDPTTSVGDLLVKGPGTPGAITRLPVGADGLALVADHTQTLGVKWGAPGGGLVDPTTSKGDLIVKPQTGPPVRLPIGTDNQLLLADSTQTNGLRWATITEFAAPGADTQVQFNKLGIPNADPRLAFNYSAGHLLIGGQPDDGSAAVLQVTGVTHTTMRVRTDQFLSAKAYANPSSLNIPDAGYGAWGYQGGSIYYYWNGNAFVSADISKLGTGLVDPTTTVGDLIVRSSTGTTRFPVGTANGQVLEVDSTQTTGIRWVTPPPSGVSSVFGRAPVVTAQLGDYSADLVSYAVDTRQSYQDPVWIPTLNWSKIISAPAFLVSPLTTQGDLVVYAAAPLNGPARLPLGINGQVLTVDSSQQLGVKWSTVALGVTSLSPGTLTGAVSLAAGANVSLNQTGQTITIGVPNMTTSGGMADPTTTTGDMIVHASTGTTRLPVGTVNGMVLQVDSTQQAGVSWKAITIPPAGVSSISPGSLTGAVSLQGGTNINLSQAGQTITISAASIGMTDPTTTQGDLIVHTSNAGTTRFAAGTTNGMVLVTDMTQPAGLRWATTGLSAPGSDMQVLVNKSGTVGADAGHTYDYTNHVLYLNADGGTQAWINSRAFSGSAANLGGQFRGYSARGSMASPTATQANDYLMYLAAFGYDGTAWQQSAQINFGTTINWAANNGAGFIAFGTNPGGTTTSERMRITSAGYVGIGSSAPTSLFEVQGGISPRLNITFTDVIAPANGNRVRLRLGPHNGFMGTDVYPYVEGIVDTGSFAGLAFGAYGGGGCLEAMRISSSYNVGIGSTGPLARLHADVGVGSTSTVAGLVYGSTVGGSFAAPGPMSVSSATLVVGTNWNAAPNNILNCYSAAGDARFLVSSSGNVGISVANPNERLQIGDGTIACGININGLNTGANGPYIWGSAAGVHEWIVASQRSFTGGGALGLAMGTLAANPVTFWMNSAERMRIDTTGYVGINNVAPSYPLDVIAGGTGPQIVARFGNSDGNASTSEARIVFSEGGIWYQGIGAPYSGGNQALTFACNSAQGTWVERMRITNTGLVGIGTNNPQGELHVNCGSDINNLYVHQNVNAGGSASVVQIQDDRGYAGANTGDTLRVWAWYNAAGSTGNVLNVYTYNSAVVTRLAVQLGGNVVLNPSVGNVGIGLLNPVDHFVMRSNVTGRDNFTLENTAGSAAGNRMRIKIAASNGFAGTDYHPYFEAYCEDTVQSTALAFGTYAGGGPYERLRISSVGNVGINTAAPAYTLHVVGDCNITGTYRVNGAPLATGGGNIQHVQVYAAAVASVTVTLPTAGYWLIHAHVASVMPSAATATWGITLSGANPSSIGLGPMGGTNCAVTSSWSWIINAAANAVCALTYSGSGFSSGAILAIYLGTT